MEIPKALRRSLWVFHLNTGACNACDIEILDALTPYHDAERLGVKLVASPRHADAILLTGPITVNAFPYVLRAIRAMPEPKIVIAIGSCACGGGIWYDSYSTLGGVPKLLEVLKKYSIEISKVIYVPGCPPKPEAILFALAMVKGVVVQKQKREVYSKKVVAEDIGVVEIHRGEFRRSIEEFRSLVEV